MKKIILFSVLLLSFLTNAQETYYDDVDLTTDGLTLKDNLAVKTIAAHTNILSYGWPALQATDVNPENSSEVLLIYGYTASGKTSRTRGINDHGGNSNEWNREHVYPKSLGTPNLGTSGPGADGHHLRPSDVGFNSDRGSLKFVDGSGNAGNVSGGWYPGDEWKGDVARIMMYMYIHYGDQCKPTGVGVGNSSATPDDMIDLFLQWNVEDPVSDFERQRNTYHENTSNTYAQGNRNPFIDNAYLATRIWGGENAIDTWGIYISPDSEAPTVPTNLALNNFTASSIDATWTASTDNVAVTKYEIFVDGILQGNTANTNHTITNLASSTTFAVTVLAKDIANNKSAQNTAVNGTTLADNEAPTVPTNVTITNQAGTSFKANWTASTDNVAVVGYDVFIDGVLDGSTADTNYNVSDLTVSTTYVVTVLAKDGTDNKSSKSTAVNATTTDGLAATNELFFSEYIEGTGSNKALEIANFTGKTVYLSKYSVKLASNGQDFGTQILTFKTEGINDGDVFVIGNSAMSICQSEIDIQSNVTYFNGNDVLGLFKDDVLIDIIGKEGETNSFGKNVTLKRKPTVVLPNVIYDANEWIETAVDDCSGLGTHNVSTASLDNPVLNSFKMYPNPVTGDNVYFKVSDAVNIEIYNVLSKLIRSREITKSNNTINVSNFSKGIYLLKVNSGNQYITKKLIKN